MVYACSSHQQGLQKAFSILVESDAGVHPATWSSEMAALKGKHCCLSGSLMNLHENCTVSLTTVMLDIHLHRCVNTLKHWTHHKGRTEKR